MIDNSSSQSSPTPDGGPPTLDSTSSISDDSRWRYGLIALALALTALVGALLIILWRNPESPTVILGVVSSPMAAIVAAYFGIQVTASTAKDAQDQARTARAQAQAAQDAKDKALADRATVLGALDPQVAEKITPQLKFKP
jgi:hypothetical protein